MRNLLNPKWLLIINTIPIVLLFILFYAQFNIIKTLLDDDALNSWQVYSLALGVLGVLNLSYALYLIVNRKSVTVFYAVIALLCYIPYIYLYSYNINNLIPQNLPRWMVSGNIFFYVGTFLMPTLAYSLFIIVVYCTPKDKLKSPWNNLAFAFLIPIVGVIFTQLILPLWQPSSDRFSVHFVIISIVIVTLLFLFFVVRSIYILVLKKENIYEKYKLAWKIPLTIILPIVGLEVNNRLLGNGIDDGVFGAFGSYWFYALAILNGVLLCLPNSSNRTYRFILFLGRSILFAYTFYFFIVFLPFLPVSVVAIIAVGTGFLMLVPLILFVIHLQQLSEDFKFLKTQSFGKYRYATFSIGFLVIPLFITFSYLQDRTVLKETLAYLYSPDYSKSYTIDNQSLKNTLSVVKQHKSRNSDMMFGGKLPYLSSYFSWIVLDNLTLSDSKINYIEKVFFGHSDTKVWLGDGTKDNVSISNITTESTFDTTQNAWKSWVNLELTNYEDSNRFSEYATTISLPEGCWISDYYLNIGDRKEFGILAEKKAAMWVYSNIVNENKDPGILYYLTGNKVAFRVFPFAEKEVRKTGIEFLHKDPITLLIDNQTIALGNSNKQSSNTIETNDIIYIPAAKKNTLKTVQRKPYFHFLINTSVHKKPLKQDFTNRIETFLEQNKAVVADAKFSFVNSYISPTAEASNWKTTYQSTAFGGGFFLDRAIKKTLIDSYNKNSYPIVVVVTDSIEKAVLDKDFTDLRFCFPESSNFYVLDKDANLQNHSLVQNPKLEILDNANSDFKTSVLEYKASDGTLFYVSNDNESSILLKNSIFKIDDTQIKSKNWQSGLNLQAAYMAQNLHPEIADQEWLPLVRSSFKSKIISPVTSYLVVENEAQKAILKQKQEQILAGNRALDPDEDTQNMSEPSIWILAGILLLLYFRQQRRRRYLGIKN